MIEKALAATTLLVGAAVLLLWLTMRRRAADRANKARDVLAERPDLVTVLATELGQRQALTGRAGPPANGIDSGDLPPKPLLVVLHGPPGAGKDAVIGDIASRLGLHRAVSSTDRAPRPGEVGKSYHFLDRAEFERKIAAGEFAEWATVHGDLKGLEIAEVLGPLLEGRDVLIQTDVQGVRTWRAKSGGMAITVSVMPDDPDKGLDALQAILERRMLKRATETPEGLKRRLAEVKAELDDVCNNDYVIINCEGDLQRAMQQLEQAIRDEREKVRRRAAEAV